jgi:hypothetical protein
MTGEQRALLAAAFAADLGVTETTEWFELYEPYWWHTVTGRSWGIAAVNYLAGLGIDATRLSKEADDIRRLRGEAAGGPG